MVEYDTAFDAVGLDSPIGMTCMSSIGPARLSSCWLRARGELCGLRWDAVDLAARVLRVATTRVQVAGGVVVGEPKTEKSRRAVTLDDAAVGALIAWKLRQEQDAAAWGDAWTDTGYVFTDEAGQAVKPDYATRLFNRIRLAARLPNITLHGARHEHASLWIEGGGDITLLSKRLGHTSSRITADIYVSRVGDADRAAAEQVAAMIPRKRSSVHTSHTQAPDTAPLSQS